MPRKFEIYIDVHNSSLISILENITPVILLCFLWNTSHEPIFLKPIISYPFKCEKRNVFRKKNKRKVNSDNIAGVK